MSNSENDAKRLTAGFTQKEVKMLDRAKEMVGMSYSGFIETWANFGAEMVSSGRAVIVNGKPEIKAA